MRISRRRAGIAGVLALALLGLSACSSSDDGNDQDNVSTGFADCETKPNECNSDKVKTGGSLTYTIEKKITGWNVLDSDTNTFDISQVVNGVLPSVFIAYPDLEPHLNPDLMVSAEQTSAAPQTLVYKIRPEAVWDDGTPITADDFIYNWQTNNGKDCTACASASTAGYEHVASVTGSDNGKTVTVVMATPYTDWRQMFGPFYPSHIAKQHGDLAASWKWFNENQPTYSGGPYKITEYQKDVSVTETANPRWYGKTKPSLEKLVFRIITEQSQAVPALQNNEVQAIYPQPNADIVSQVKAIPNVQFTLGKGLVWEHFDMNLKNEFLADKALRLAMFTATNTKDIIAKTIGQFAPNSVPLGSHNFMPGQPGYVDQVTPTGQGTGDLEKAKKVLTDAGYTGVGTELKTRDGRAVPALRVRYTAGNVLRQQTCELFQAQMKALGITITVEPTQTLGPTLTSGDFDVILYAWVGTPFPFQGAIQLWGSESESNYAKWVNKDSDTAIQEAAAQTDPAKANELLNKSGALLAGDAVVLPLFQKPTFLAVYSQYANVRDNATNQGPTYNVEAWGLRASVS